MATFLPTQDERGAEDFIAEHGIDGTIDLLSEVQHKAMQKIEASNLLTLITPVARVFQESANALRDVLASRLEEENAAPVRDAIARYMHRLHALLDLEGLEKEAQESQRTIAVLSTNDLLKRHEDSVIKHINADTNVSNEAKAALINNIVERRALWESTPVAPYFRTRLLYLRDAEKYLDVRSEEWTTIEKAVIEPRAGTPWIYRRIGDQQLAAYTPQFGVQVTDVSIGYWQQVATRTEEETIFPEEERDDVHSNLCARNAPRDLRRARANFEMEQYFRGRRDTFPQEWNPEWYALCFADAN